MDIITSDNNLPDSGSYAKMCQEFGIDHKQVRRQRKIELLILMRGQHLHPDPIQRIRGMKLADRQLGKVFGGTSSRLKFNPTTLCCPARSVEELHTKTIYSTTMKTMVRQEIYTTPMKAEKEILNFFEEDQIGVHCEPRCGDCHCGTCALGSKQMSIHDKKEYEIQVFDAS